MTWWLAIWIIIALAMRLVGAWARARALRARYWNRPCAGMRWHQAFRHVPPTEIRSFLHRFVSAFAFPTRRALQFRPDDRLSEVYFTDQIGDPIDNLQIEAIDEMLRDQYGRELDLSDPALTLGEIFAATRHPSI